MTLSVSSLHHDTKHRVSLVKKIVTFLCFLLLVWGAAQADTSIFRFESPEQERLYHELIAELRCPQCQNNNIAESNAGLSADMRAKVYDLVNEGQSKKEIVQYMVDRYGNFITYDPPMTAATMILWIAPIISLLIGLLYVIFRARRTAAVRHVIPDEIAPSTSKAKKKAKADERQQQVLVIPQGPTSYSFIAVSLAFIAVVTAIIFYKVNDWDQIDYEKQAVANVPELVQRYQSNQMASMEEFQQLFVGLRSSLLQTPNNGDYWMLLGELYETFLNRPDESFRALENAYQYDSSNINVRSKYAEMILRSTGNPRMRLQAIELLKGVLQEQPNHLNAMYWLAAYAQSEQKYAESIPLWERMLTILPDPNVIYYQTIQNHLERDKLAYEQQAAQ